MLISVTDRERAAKTKSVAEPRANAALEVEAQVRNRDIGHLQVGQRVVSKIEIFLLAPLLRYQQESLRER